MLGATAPRTSDADSILYGVVTNETNPEGGFWEILRIDTSGSGDFAIIEGEIGLGLDYLGAASLPGSIPGIPRIFAGQGCCIPPAVQEWGLPGPTFEGTSAPLGNPFGTFFGLAGAGDQLYTVHATPSAGGAGFTANLVARTVDTWATESVVALSIAQTFNDLAIARDRSTIFGLGFDAAVGARRLYRIDPATGATTIVGGGTLIPLGVGGLAIDENGDLWSVNGATGELLSIDKDDGSFSVVGSDPDLVAGISGLAPAFPVPEPLSGLLVGLGLAVASVRARSPRTRSRVTRPVVSRSAAPIRSRARKTWISRHAREYGGESFVEEHLQ